MKQRFLDLCVLVVFTLMGCSTASKDLVQASVATQSENAKSHVVLQPPVAEKIPYAMTAHGQTRIDNYYWMRDDQRKDPKVIAHLEAENAYTQQQMTPLTGLTDVLFDELKNRIEKDDSSVPVFDNDYWYYRRYSGEQEYPIYARKQKTLDAQEQVLLDGNQMAEGKEYFAIGDYSVSPNNQLLAYTTDTLSRRFYQVRVKDLTTGELLPDIIENTDGSVIWANDNQTLFYVKKDLQTLLGFQVYRHQLGTPSESDVLVFEQTNSEFYTWITKSDDKQEIYINQQSTESSGVSVIDANQPASPPQLFAAIEPNIEYSVSKLGDQYFVYTNWNATNFKLMRVDKAHTQDKTKWQDIVPYRADIYLADVAVFDQHLVIKEKRNGLMQITVSDLDWQNPQVVPFNDDLYVARLMDNHQQDSSVFRVQYSSLTTPDTVFDIDLNSFAKTMKKQTKVQGGFDSTDYQAERLFIKARDGQQVPVSLVYKKQLFKKDGSNPLYQYGYGSYGLTIEPEFYSSWLSLVDRGFVVAIAHVRGSQMLGRPWYEDGKILNKKNTFTDFIDVTKGLVAENYADQTKVFAEGGSAGGLLMGAIVNMAPELYKGVAAHVAFVDVITTMSDESIPLTTLEWKEWGNPANKEEYDYMLSYSPYDQVKAQDYPNMYISTGLHDSQVMYFEPMKWVAKLRELKTDNNQLLFDINMEAGHGGASGRFHRLHKQAQEYAFFIDLAGIK